VLLGIDSFYFLMKEFIFVGTPGPFPVHSNFGIICFQFLSTVINSGSWWCENYLLGLTRSLFDNQHANLFKSSNLILSTLKFHFEHQFGYQILIRQTRFKCGSSFSSNKLSKKAYSSRRCLYPKVTNLKLLNDKRKNSIKIKIIFSKHPIYKWGLFRC
jgi:hypothetical protein